jgi:hypothetical protein
MIALPQSRAALLRNAVAQRKHAETAYRWAERAVTLSAPTATVLVKQAASLRVAADRAYERLAARCPDLLREYRRRCPEWNGGQPR